MIVTLKKAGRRTTSTGRGAAPRPLQQGAEDTPPPPGTDGGSTSNRQKVAQGSKKRVGDSDPDPLSHAGRARLSADINRLSTANLSDVLNILRSELPGLNTETVDVDVTKLSDSLVLRLVAFVRHATCEAKKRKESQKAEERKRRKHMTPEDRKCERAEELCQISADLAQVERDLVNLDNHAYASDASDASDASGGGV